jgi:hypothetical protein
MKKYFFIDKPYSRMDTISMISVFHAFMSPSPTTIIVAVGFVVAALYLDQKYG